MEHQAVVYQDRRWKQEVTAAQDRADSLPWRQPSEGMEEFDTWGVLNTSKNAKQS